MKRLGLLGASLSYSYSPQIHKWFFESLKLDSKYSICEVAREELEGFFINRMREFDGLNVTIPYKKDVIKYLDELDIIAGEIGAVNTVKVKGDELIGYNTDYYGFGATLGEFGIPVKNKTAYIIGTGGVSRAVYHYLKDNGAAEIVFVNRNTEHHWAKDAKILSFKQLDDISGDIVVNCTPLGMGKLVNKSPLNEKEISNFKYAVDLVYNPEETLFLKYGRRQGLQTVNGLYMLVAQAAKSEEIWNEVVVDREVIKEVYCKIKDYISAQN